jgi:hypothetical protein
MILSTLPSEEEKSFFRQLTLPVEDRLARSKWNGSPRWFRWVNVVDLWGYRSKADQHRMIDLAWSRRQNRCDGGPPWPPPSFVVVHVLKNWLNWTSLPPMDGGLAMGETAGNPLTATDRLALADRDSGGRFVKGHKPSGGRPKGALGVVTRSIREQILDGLGSVEAFVKELKTEQPGAAAALLSKLIPPPPEETDPAAGGCVTVVNILPIRSGTFILPDGFDGPVPPHLKLVVAADDVPPDPAS